jgi:hypothetical protein
VVVVTARWAAALAWLVHACLPARWFAPRTRRPGDGARVFSRADGQPTRGGPGLARPCGHRLLLLVSSTVHRGSPGEHFCAPPRSEAGSEPGPELRRLPSDSSQDSQPTWASVVVAHSASRVVLPNRRAPPAAPAARSGLRPWEQGRALQPGPGWAGRGDQLALGRDMRSSVPMRLRRGATWDAVPPGAQALPVSPCRG